MQTSTVALVPLLLLLAAATTASVAAPGLGKFQCNVYDTECLKDYLQDDVFERFSKGFPEFGVKPFDPLQFEDLSFNYEVGPAVQFTLNHTGAILYGLAKTKVLGVRAHVTGSNFIVEARVSIPKLLYEGSYTCNGEFLLLPVDWSGKFNISLGDVTNTMKLTADLVKNGDNTFLDLKNLSFDFNVTTFNTYASGLFWGVEDIDKFALAMTNKYWRGFFDVMWRLAEPDVISTVSDAVVSIFSKTPVTGLADMQQPTSTSSLSDFFE